LAWVALGPPISLERPRSLYEREIQPNEKKIVWYKLADRLPNVTPPEAKPNPRPPRARARFEQNIAAGPRDTARPPQLILGPAPEITPSKPIPLPNIVAVAPPPPPPRLVRPFIPPPVQTLAPEKAPALPDAPKPAAAPEPKALALDVKAPRPVRRFTPPAVPKKTLPPDPAPLAAAPELAAAAPEPKALALDVKAPRPVRRFTPPAVPKKTLPPDPAPLAAAPELAAAAPEPKALALDVKAPRPVRRFTPPAVPKRTLPPDPVPLAAAPELAAAAEPNASLPKMPKPFVAPPKNPPPAETPAIAAPPPAITSAAVLTPENSLVIAGLNPTKSVAVPTPPGSVRGGFSGGPKPQPKGSEGAPTGALLEVPSLTIQGGARQPQPPVMVARVSPTSPEAMAAALRMAHVAAPAPGGSTTRPAVRAADVPDPRMYGRQVYTMAIQAPNLTSYSGSWLVWFAGREQEPGGAPLDMRPPLPLRVVDPKYIPSAADERVEGKVRLWAVIGKDGHITGVALLQHLDERLDRSAEEALAKWLFQPAQFNGRPVDVDAVFEIPFTLAPKSQR
jgi:TonB family protein